MVPNYTYVSDKQAVFDVVRGRLKLEDIHEGSPSFHALLVTVLVLRSPREYCDGDGWLKESPRKTVIKVLGIGHWRADAIVQQLTNTELMVHDGTKRRIVASQEVEALLVYIEVYYGRFEALTPEQKNVVGALTNECCELLGGDPTALAALAYALLRRAGAPLP